MATAACLESTPECDAGDDESASLEPHRRTSSTKLSDKSLEERDSSKMLSSSLGGSGGSSLFSPTKKKRGFLRVSSPAVNTDGDKKENAQKTGGGVEPTAPPSRRFVLPLFHSNQSTNSKRDRRSSADAQLKVPKMRVLAETPTPTSEGMSLFQRLTQGRSGSTSVANRTPTSPSKVNRHLSDASDLRPHTSSSSKDRDNTPFTLQTVDEADGSPIFSFDPSPSPQPRTLSRMSTLAVDKVREDTMAQMREVRAKQEQLTKLHFDLYSDQRRFDALHQSKPESEEERKRARERQDSNYERLTDALRDLQKSMRRQLFDMSLFTVEQLELIRRLRMTGITAEAVIEAFHSLDRFDLDVNALVPNLSTAQRFVQSYATTQQKTMSSLSSARLPLALKPPSLSTSTQSHIADAQSPTENISNASPILLQHLRNQAPIPVTINAVAPAVSTPALAYALSNDSAAVQKASSLISNLLQHQQLHAVSVPMASTAGEMLSTLPTGLPPYPSPPTSSGTSVCRPIRSQRTPMRDIITLDDPQELEEFLSHGEEQCIADMKQFVTQYSLRQTTVAHMTGVSQPYISKLLNGNHRELSLRCRRNIYSWYLNCRRHPEKISSYVADPCTRLETNGDGELIPQRRERYVFRPILIRILERYFAENQFPDLEKRMEVANACNQALQAEKKGMGLMPKEIVSPQVVANWFANKRKELRRRSDASNEGATHGGHQQSSSDAASTPSPSSIVLDTVYSCGSGRPLSLQRQDSHSPVLVIDGAPKDIDDSLANIQSQLDAVNNSVLTLVNPYLQAVVGAAIKTEADSE